LELWTYRDGKRESVSGREVLAAGKVVVICPGALQVQPQTYQNAEPTGELERLFQVLGRLEGPSVARRLRREIGIGHTGAGMEFDYNDAIVRRRLGPTLEGDTRIVHVAHSSAASNLIALAASHLDGNFCSPDARQFVSEVFAPHITKPGNGAFRARLNQLTLFGISYGSAFVLELEQALDRALMESRYAKPQRAKALATVVAISISNVSHFASTTGPGFTSVYFEGSNDQIASAFNPNQIRGLRGALSMLRVSQNRALIVGRIPRTVKSWVELEKGFDSEELKGNRGAHFIPFFTLRSNPGTLMPALIERALRNAVRGNRSNLQSLLESLPGSTESIKEAAAISKWFSHFLEQNR
jgi:hypothetical protein